MSNHHPAPSPRFPAPVLSTAPRCERGSRSHKLLETVASQLRLCVGSDGGNREHRTRVESVPKVSHCQGIRSDRAICCIL